MPYKNDNDPPSYPCEDFVVGYVLTEDTVREERQRKRTLSKENMKNDHDQQNKDAKLLNKYKQAYKSANSRLEKRLEKSKQREKHLAIQVQTYEKATKKIKNQMKLLSEELESWLKIQKTWEVFQKRVLDLEKENEHFKIENELLKQQILAQTLPNNSHKPLRATETVSLKPIRENNVESRHQIRPRSLYIEPLKNEEKVHPKSHKKRGNKPPKENASPINFPKKKMPKAKSSPLRAREHMKSRKSITRDHQVPLKKEGKVGRLKANELDSYGLTNRRPSSQMTASKAKKYSRHHSDGQRTVETKNLGFTL